MILYDDRQNVSLFEFGIQIPIFDSKAVKTFEQLKAHPVLGKKIRQWHRIPSRAEKITRRDLLRVHSGEYVGKLFSSALEQEIIRTFELIDAAGNPHRWDPQKATAPLTALFERILYKVSGTWQCCKIALETGFCFYFGGGMHHAQRDFGNGFCLVNDIIIALRKLQAQKSIQNAWVIDVDAHKGDGTAALTADDDTIKTLSIHMARGWPLDGDPYDDAGNLNPSFIPSDIDIPMAPGEEDRYVPELALGLERLDAMSTPDLAVVVSGADPFEADELPSTQGLRLSLEHLLERDRLVYTFLKERSIPRAYLMAGGYGHQTWRVYTGFLRWALQAFTIK